MPKIRNLDATIHKFNEGCLSLTEAIEAWRRGFMSLYESKLSLAATQIGNALELGLKVFLKSICSDKLTEDERASFGKNPTFHDLMRMMDTHATPSLDVETRQVLYDFRELVRNPAEHDASVPPIRYLHVAIGSIRHVLLTYLPIEENQLRSVDIAFTADGSLDAQVVATSANSNELVVELPPLHAVSMPRAKKVTLLHKLHDPDGPIMWVTFSPDGRTLASSGSVFSVRLWDVASGVQARQLIGFEGVNSLAYSPNGLILATGSPYTIRLWSVPTGQKKLEMRVPTAREVFSLAFSPDGLTIASGSDTTTSIWDARSGSKLLDLPDHITWVSSLSFSPRGRLLALASADAHIWDVEQQREVQRFVGIQDRFMAVAFSPSGRILALGGRDGTLRLWDMDENKEFKQLIGHSSGVASLTFSPDEQTLASGGCDKTLRLWNVATGMELQQIGEHPYGVFEVCFSSDGHALACANNEETIHVWHIE